MMILCFPAYRSTMVAVFISLLGITEVHGQVGAAARRGPTARANATREVTVQETFVPAFSIEPLMQKVEGRAGDVVAFQFKVQSSNRAANIEVAAIGLRQEIYGQILHDEQADKTELIRLVTPSSMSLAANVPAIIEGLVRMPKGDAKFHSLGILVRDMGTGEEMKPLFNLDGSQKTQAGIRFVTQYVLRLDLEVKGVRGEAGRELTIEEVKMTPFEGRPQLQAIILNPTDTTFEFELRGRLRSSPSDRSFKPLRMLMPIRKSVEDEMRYVGRILPKTRLRMEELLPEAISGGQYDVDMELIFEGQVIKRQTFPVDIDALDFPAQEVLIGQVDEGLQVSPTQIELSKLSGGNRRVTMLLKNNAKETKTINLKAVSASGLEIGGVLIQPSEFQLSPSSNRKVSLTLRTNPGDERTLEYGVVRVEARSTGRDYQVSRELPLAILLSAGPDPNVSMSPLQWDPSEPYPSFRTRLENVGDTHLPIQSRLLIIDESGRRTSIPAGFGRWLMPKSSAALEFRLDTPLTPGQYRLRCEVQRAGEPLVFEQSFTVTDMEMATAGVN